MKKQFLFLVSCTILLINNYSCGKSKIAFTHATMKPWFDVQCTSCHASGKPNAAQWLYDPSDYAATITSHLGHLKETIHDKKSMPPPAGATTAEIQAFKVWFDAGAPAN